MTFTRQGLEFPPYFCPVGRGCSRRTVYGLKSGLKGLEEERRLAMVGIKPRAERCGNDLNLRPNRRVSRAVAKRHASRFYLMNFPKRTYDVLTPLVCMGGGYGAAMPNRICTKRPRGRMLLTRRCAGCRPQQGRGTSQPTEARNMTIDMVCR